MFPIRRSPEGGSVPRFRGSADVGWLGLGGVRVGRVEQCPEAIDELGRYLVAPALRPQELLQPPLERGVPATGVATAQVPLDLQAHGSDELTVEVELDLLQHMFAVSR
jgi:hypothetical protein